MTGVLTEQGRVTGVETARGTIKCKKLAVVAAGHSSVIADMAGFRLPIESFPLQALVSEPVKPCVNTVIMSNAVHGYISQSDKGELVIGAGTDQFTSYSQRGSSTWSSTRCRRSSSCSRHSRACACCASGAASSTSRRTAARSSARRPVENMFINCGWGTGGFKATPGSGHVFAHTVATGEPHRASTRPSPSTAS